MSDINETKKPIELTASEKLELAKEKQTNRSRWFGVFFALFIVSLLGLTVSHEIASAMANRYDNEQEIAQRTLLIRIVFTVPIFFFIFFAVFLYLEGFSFRPKQTSTRNESGDDDFLIALRAVEDATKRVSDSRVLTETDMKRVQEILDQSVAKSLPESLLGRIESKYGRTMQNGIVASGLDDLFQRTKARLNDFRFELSRKANVNLTAGLIVGFVGLIVLTVIIFNSDGSAILEDTDKYFYYISRLSLVLIVEYVAFFFLRQYRKALEEEKFFANEVTNVELKLLALKTATQLGLDQGIDYAIADLSATDRNALAISKVPVGSGSINIEELSKLVDGIGKLNR